jgi:curved DNA-binding protein CbpA
VSARIPILNRGIDVYSLPLSTKEGFILSRVDGSSSVEDISMMVGVKLAELLTVLDRLADLGVVHLAWRVAAARVVENKTGSEPPPPPPLKGEAHPAVQRVLAAPLYPRYSDAELNTPANLTLEQKKRILNGFYGVEGKNFYELLGLERTADKKEIRAAYFELSRLFHPDSMFGKELGPFRTKMETVFKRLTEAYEVLGRAPRRREYDEYLASTTATSAMQQTLDQVQHEVRALSTAPPRQISTPAQEAVREPARTSRDPQRATLMPPPSEQAQRESIVGLRPPASFEERKASARERLRRSFPQAALAGSLSASPPPLAPDRLSVRPPSPMSAPVSVSERRDSAIKGLRQTLRQTGQNAAGMETVMAHLRQARESEQSGDLLGAASALQAALMLQPEHKDLQAQYERVSKAVTRNLATNYEKQARYEEKQGKWAAAALSWERVAEGRPENAEASRATADALLKASGDLRKAQHYAQRAVDAGPSDTANVVSLVRVLLAAGMRLNARRELEKAVKLDPQNEMIKNLLREAR